MSATQFELFHNEDVERGRQLRDEGIERAINHAERENIGWSDKAYALFVRYAQSCSVFATEEARQWAYTFGGLPTAPEERAWGAIAVRARKNGIIEPEDFTHAIDPKCHRRPRQRWRVL